MAEDYLIFHELEKFYDSVPRKSWCSFPLVVLAQTTVLVLQTVLSDRVVCNRDSGGGVLVFGSGSR